jgi:hypothetical protein
MFLAAPGMPLPASTYYSTKPLDYRYKRHFGRTLKLFTGYTM